MIHIYTDGACEPNPGYGGWGFVVYENGLEVAHRNGGNEATTNNIMEMTAVREALRYAKGEGMSAAEVIIHTDSQYVRKGCVTWRHSWAKKVWKRGPDEPLKNAELWQAIASAHDWFPCKIVWVRGHSGVAGNERADQLAADGREDFMPAHALAEVAA